MSNQVTSISARGTVVTDFDTATFALSFNEFAPKAREAKLKLKKGVEKITKALDELKGRGLEFLKNNYRSNIAVQPNYVYDRNTNQNKMEGQKATYTVTFQTPTLEMVNEVYDVLSELDVNEYTVNSPSFSVRDEGVLKQQALEDAWRIAQVLFNNQCKVLGFDPTKFSVNSWQVNYAGQNHGSIKGGYSNSVLNGVGGSASYDEDGAIELNTGRALIEVILTANYIQTGS